MISCDRRENNWSPKGKIIESVTIGIIGERTVNESQLENVIQSVTGSSYSSARTDDDIRALYQSGHVEEVRVSAEPHEGKVRLVFEVATRSSLGPPLFVGNTAFSDARLTRELDFDARTKVEDLSVERLQANATKIEGFYRSNGYPKTRVSIKPLHGEPTTLDDLQFIIEESNPRSSE